MRANDTDILTYLLNSTDAPGAVNLIAFAQYAEEKRVWLGKINSDKSRPATVEEIESWIGNWTDVQLERLREASRDFFDEAARLYLAEEFEAAKRSVRNETLIREVKAAGSWWRQLAIALITGIMTPLILALVLFLATKHLPDPSEIVRGKLLPEQNGSQSVPR